MPAHGPTHPRAEPRGPEVTSSPILEPRPIDHASERARLLEEIREGLGEPRLAEPAAQQDPSRPATPTESAPGQSIRDRTGGELAAFTKALQADFMPLASECYERAREEDPDLQGMLDIEMEIIADEEVGGLVETLAYGEGNELDDPELSECIRETMFSTIFPSPDGSGRRGVRLTLVMSPDEG